MELTPAVIIAGLAVLLALRKDIYELFRNKKQDVVQDVAELERVNKWAREECARIEAASIDRDHNIALKIAVFQNSLEHLESDVHRLQSSSDRLREAIKQTAVEVLHDPHPDHREKDDLLDKLRTGELAPEEIPILIKKAQELSEDPHQPEGRRLYATLFVWSLEEEQRKL